jgi:hypothetical protein
MIKKVNAITTANRMHPNTALAARSCWCRFM